MPVNLELYRVFYYVVRYKSISKAAKELFVSQPAVSQSIKQLENSLGGQLFFRTPKGLKLTPEGEVLFKHVEQGYNFIMAAESKFEEMQNLVSGEVRIGASDMALKYCALPCLETFHKQFPNVKIKVISGSTPKTISNLKRGLIDIGVISLPVESDNLIDIVEYTKIQDCFVGSQKYKWLSSEPISLKDLLKYPILMLEENTSTRKYIDNFTKKHNIEIKPEFELTTSDLLVQFAKRGLGISCVVRNFAEEELNSGLLYEIEIIEKIPPRKLGLATLSDVPLSASAKKLLSLMV